VSRATTSSSDISIVNVVNCSVGRLSFDLVAVMAASREPVSGCRRLFHYLEESRRITPARTPARPVLMSPTAAYLAHVAPRQQSE
jgi:hypothetical protein